MILHRHYGADMIIGSACLWLEEVKSSIYKRAPERCDVPERRDGDAGKNGEAADGGGEPSDDGRGDPQRGLGAQGLRRFRRYRFKV